MNEDPREVVEQIFDDLKALLLQHERLNMVRLHGDHLFVDLKDEHSGERKALSLEQVISVFADRLDRDTHADIVCESDLDIGEYEAVTGR